MDPFWAVLSIVVAAVVVTVVVVVILAVSRSRKRDAAEEAAASFEETEERAAGAPASVAEEAETAPSARTRAETFAVVNSLDFTHTRAKAQKQYGWDDAKAADLERQYRQFLYLAATNPGKMVVPWSKDLDHFWHMHILDTRQYPVDCDKVFGKYFHHDPHTVTRRATHHNSAAKRTRYLRTREFGSGTVSGGGSSDTMVLVLDTPASVQHEASGTLDSFVAGNDAGVDSGDGGSGDASGSDGSDGGSGDAGGSDAGGGSSCGGGGGGGCGGGGGGGCGGS